MNLNIIENFLNKNVEVYISNKTYYGILSFSIFDAGVIEVQPVDSYVAKRYGPVSISIDDIISIRQVKTIPQKDWDECEDKCEAECEAECEDDSDMKSDYIPGVVIDFLEEKKG